MSSRRIAFTITAVALGAAGFLAGRHMGERAAQEERPAQAGETPGQEQLWTCSMHPQIRMRGPGKCPICFMDLIPVEAGGAEDTNSTVLEMTAAAAALAEIETAPVERRLVAREVSMVGKVAFDETRLSYITAWVRARLDRLFVDYTGVTVHKGDHMVEVYSPKLFAAQQELLQALETSRRIESSPLEVLRESTTRTAESARERLRLWGLTRVQIDEIVARGEASEHVTLFAPTGGVVVEKNALQGMYVDEGTLIYTIADLSKVWVLLEAYESDLAWLRYGQDVELRVRAFPGEVFHGRVAFIDPVLDDHTRTVKVRLNVENAEGRLKPGMFVSAVLDARLTPGGQVVDERLEGMWMCPMHPEILSDHAGKCPECGMDLRPTGELGFAPGAANGHLPLVIPATAPLITGRRAVVYVRLDAERPTFEGREVELGPRAGDWYVVHSGLSEGEEVVVQGNFKLDSELQIRAKPSMMSPPSGESGGASVGRLHSSPESFRAQLGSLSSAYLRLQQALAGDDEPESVRAARALGPALDAVDASALEGEARDQWSVARDWLERAVAELGAAGGLEDRRAAFANLSQALIRALELFGYEREGELGVFHCPMAFDGRGAEWIQAGGRTTNPYFGAAMHQCGARTRDLPGSD